MNVVDMGGKEIDYVTLLKHSQEMRMPCVFNSVSMNQSVENCTIEEISTFENKGFVSTVHSGSYWSRNPLISDVINRKCILDLDRIFVKNEGGYYVTYFRRNALGKNGWLTTRTCGNNHFDEYLAERTEFKDYMKGSYLHNHWVSNGGTFSALHADPVSTLFMQIKGRKKITLVPESLKVFMLSDFKQPHKLKYSLTEVKEMGLRAYEFEVGPGDAIFIPAWCFHEIESIDIGLNISLTSHYQRRKNRLLPSPLHMLNRYRRVWYPKFVRKKRIIFQLENLDRASRPFYPWFSSFMQNKSYELDTNNQHQYMLINARTKTMLPLTNSTHIQAVAIFDGIKTIQEISESTSSDITQLLALCHELIEREFIQILFDAEDRFNYFYQNIEART
ncbi:hypothetical protein D3C81_76570 [compost metagenome]|uniref:cupin-like domain-containing protein n=1 Tax=Serratia plymuthica TaxID=82996 RepID=UPI0002A31F95|nr:cupin-like domain-containing protein [Serratia plymuthica]ANJ94053.1 cupin [Serratia plymuthica]EKF62433.1 cupin-like domain protein [Serratia plymuthica A30]MBI6138086.1 cupin-like domain-containing protein [Serratia plymuthica]